MNRAQRRAAVEGALTDHALAARVDATVHAEPAPAEARRARVHQRLDTLSELACTELLERVADFGEREIGRCAS